MIIDSNAIFALGSEMLPLEAFLLKCPSGGLRRWISIRCIWWFDKIRRRSGWCWGIILKPQFRRKFLYYCHLLVIPFTLFWFFDCVLDIFIIHAPQFAANIFPCVHLIHHTLKMCIFFMNVSHCIKCRHNQYHSKTHLSTCPHCHCTHILNIVSCDSFIPQNFSTNSPARNHFRFQQLKFHFDNLRSTIIFSHCWSR